MTDPARSATRSPAASSPQAGVGPPPRLSLGGDDIDVRTSDQQIGSAMSGGDGAGPIGQQHQAEIGDGGPAPASEKNWFARTRDRLRDRKVPRWTGKGATAGLVTTGVGGGIAVAAGKGAAIGAAVGSVIPGVGTVGGALIGSLVGAALAAGVGALIGYAAAGGGSRDKAEQAIDSLRGDGLIAAQDAEWLKGQSSAELKALCRIPRWAHLPDADREPFRKLLLLTAVKEGPAAFQALRGEVLNYASSRKAGTVARNLLAVQACLHRDPSWQQLDDEKQEEVLRYMHDSATAAARQGTILQPGDAQRLADAARRRAEEIDSPNLDGIRRRRDEAVQEMGALLDELRRDQPSLQRVVDGLLKVNDLLQEMRGYEQQADRPQAIRVHAENVAGEAIAGSTAYANDLLEEALRPGRALRTVVLGAQAYSEQAATPAEQQRATAILEGARSLVRTLGEIGGPATGRLEADQAVLTSAWPGAHVAQTHALVERAIRGPLIPRLTMEDSLDTENEALEFAEWAVDAGVSARIGVIIDIERTQAATGAIFDSLFATVSGRLAGDAAALPPGMTDRLQQARGNEAEMRELLGQCRDSLAASIPVDAFRAWQQQSAQGREPDTDRSSDDGSAV